MFSILILTHGNLAESMLKNLGVSSEYKSWVYSLCIDEDTNIKSYSDSINKLILEISEKSDVVVLTDFPLSSAFNCAVFQSKKHNFYHLTGLNMPLLQHLYDSMRNGYDISKACVEALAYAHSQLFDVNRFLKELS